MTFTWYTLTNELVYFQLSAYIQCYLYLYAWWLSAETLEANSVITTYPALPPFSRYRIYNNANYSRRLISSRVK